MGKNHFKIVNASAGSGKTYNLVHEYLKILLEDPSDNTFKHSLALTFTNKSVNSMKSRIIETLFLLSIDSNDAKSYSDDFCKFFDISKKELAFRSTLILKKIFLEYGAFSVITLDKFTHRLVRIFYREFNLPFGFEVSLDSESLIEETIDSILDEIGIDRLISKYLLDFSLQKINNNKDWDVEIDLKEFIPIILNENDRIPANYIKKRNTKKLEADRVLLSKLLKNEKLKVLKYATGALNFLESLDLKADDFTQKRVHKYFENISKGSFTTKYFEQLEFSLSGEKPLYNFSLSEEKKVLIEKNKDKIEHYFFSVKKSITQILSIQRTLASWTPRLLLQLMEERLERIQNEKKIRINSDFNEKINLLVKDEPTPFIYERLGVRYQHYFLDEFQDTSTLQWNNLIPLISNSVDGESLSGKKGSLFLVGDPKQSIYRWRGGDMNQFIDLVNNIKNPFQISASQEILKTNYRSFKEIVDFNKGLFQIISNSFENKYYRRLYGESSWQKHIYEGGYVNVQAIPKEGIKAITTPQYISKTLDIIKKLVKDGYDQTDIAILVRKKEQATEIGNEMIKEGFNISSSESMLVNHSIKVQLIIAILYLSSNPNSSRHHKTIFDILYELSNRKIKDYHQFAINNLNVKTSIFFSQLESNFGLKLDLEKIKSKTILDAVEYILIRLSTFDTDDIYLSSFLEDVLEFSKSFAASIDSYLSHWEIQSTRLRIATSETNESIKLMTIHKAKGLEFPVVILPFMDSPIYPNVIEKIWYPFKDKNLKNIGWGWFNFSNEIKYYGKEGNELHKSYRLSQKLDALNVLYVALTRAVEAMFIITKEVDEGDNTYAHLLKKYIISEGDSFNSKTPFTRGELLIKTNKNRELIEKAEIKDHYSLQLNLGWKQHLVLDSMNKKNFKSSKAKGVLIHNLLAQIITSDMVADVLQKAIVDKIIPIKIKGFVEKSLRKVVTHAELKSLYNGQDKVLCEEDLLVPNGPTLRPDRINIKKSGGVCVIDYKTGTPKKTDQSQILSYSTVLNNMGYFDIENILVYINDNVQILKI